MTHDPRTIQDRDGVAVVIYEKPECSQCTLSKKRLDEAGVVYGRVDITEDPYAFLFVKNLGYMAAPVLYVSTPEEDLHWYGFRPDLIAKHITGREDAA
ncbi:glutaredoxin domain-containing protein [Arthrobacter woluwensis]|uniref:Glutaredoxin-like protein NrdH n=1 Tax=Arthrobacter woluwensis TaxID=156980 RepID=A0A1H4WAK8_9MICC|nr:glutaredoxin domain-containing protein [Arthrobacter woluwensis]SEC53824.1 glutaredoxin-like protein NrdH [Arthrobacter woluwensis]SEC90283.1 glutaredoxin-like protein NrdH [Arthrobacter woluwensis]SEC95380.1 ribonucleoside-diphosphate reductase class Ib glutaredoxin subunit [Arthrobacter woluwensis]